MLGFFPSLWEGLGEGAKLDAHRPSPQPSQKGEGEKTRNMNFLAGKITLPLCAIISLGWMSIDQSPSNKNSTNVNSGKGDNTAAAQQRIRVDNLIILGQSAPPEVAGDLLLTIASSPLITDKERKIQLIEQVFRGAAQAREPVRRKSWSRQVDTRAGLKQMAYDLKLDKLSMESDSVLRMIQSDHARARTMFESIELPSIKPLTCEDSLGYDLDSYYQAMMSVAEQCFDDNEKKAGMHIVFLSDRLENVKSIPQLSAAAKMLFNAKLSSEEFSLLANVLTKALGRVSADARAFAFAIDRGENLVYTLHRLVFKMRQLEIPARDFSNAMRSFLVKQMSADVCSDVSWLEQGKLTLPRQVAEINNEFTSPITVDDIHPTNVGPKAVDVIYWTTPKAEALLQAARRLRFGGTEKALSREERETEEWRRNLLDFLGLLADWSPESEVSPEDYFQEKCILYGVLVDVCPDDAQRDVILRAYGTYLKERSGEYKGRIEWIVPLKDYLRRLRSKSDVVRRASLDPWLTSSDGNLRIYAELALLTASKN